ncbi:lysosomal alpha-mannosidase [Capsaspora owczarzaki ATCC 30864]|uniref:Alpha-mannosidase n=1 Tax=Capsaspora owczarzaki (strain ATCC 30864) TaxID=595528 RepID=A0A0D2WP12_CAPO3|nr:lysosomal alpha-mannosidase [Capsaspora owczarzaki ATCC 30864]KJE92298.1 lysosomal alpha-mannosidase [Capsaspora owczarzaki ATCC 30864]|eukprot:XP_004364138.2 lysosomal alpha-mannosidase [Capsaspora owczarzaki ATCC 30864]
MTLRSAVFVAVCIFAALATCSLALPARSAPKYNTSGGPMAGKLNVHLVAHTHDDVGWLKNPDQYYAGLNNSIQDAKVQFVLDTVMQELELNPDRKFIYVEIYFFSRWWQEQDEDTQKRVKEYVQQGRLEFINGGIVMSDEAATHYVATIDQMTLGHRFLLNTFGVKPRIGWHIDPFGHSNEFASLFAQMSFDGFFFGRIDYQDKDRRLKDKDMEMIWRGSSSLGAASEIFAGVNYNGYNPPDGFCFDQYCGDDSIQDDFRLEDVNVEERVNDFVAACLDQAQHYRTNNIQLTMGSDFQYSNARLWFKNLDKLIHYVNADGRVNVFYSTPSIYLDSLHAANLTWSYKTDDFFPYADGPHAYWTGYFTSRIALKGFERTSSAFLQSCKQLEAVRGHSNLANSEQLNLAVAVLQHHDGVSGTSKQHVAYDYARRVSEGLSECETVINRALGDLTFVSGPSVTEFVQCPLLNVSICAMSETSANFTLVVYNPVGFARAHLPRFPVPFGSYAVYDEKGLVIPSQVVSMPFETQRLRAEILGEEAAAAANYLLVFAVPTTGFGFATYFVNRTSGPNGEDVALETAAVEKIRSAEEFIDTGAESFAPKADVTMENQNVIVTFDGNTGRLKSLTNKISQISSAVTQDFFYYNSSWGTSDDEQASGAYIFRPNRTAVFPVNAAPIGVTVVRGSVFQEVRQVFSNWVTQIVRLYDGDNDVEFEYTIGPIPYDIPEGKEVITRFSSDLASGGTFYTDANGREMQRRDLNYRPTWKLNVTEPVAGNYYPVNSRIHTIDKTNNRQLSILTDRSMGGSSLADGQLELMVHRRLFYDDSRGVGEPLNETGLLGTGLVIRGIMYVTLETAALSPRAVHPSAVLIAHPVAMALAPLSTDVATYVANHVTSWTALDSPLPPNIHLLTFEILPYGPSHLEVLLRLEHFYEVNEDTKYSGPVTLDLSTLFDPSVLTVTSAVEYNLSANQRSSQVSRLQWSHTAVAENKAQEAFFKSIDAGISVTLQPMQIRTFQLSITRV